MWQKNKVPLRKGQLIVKAIVVIVLAGIILFAFPYIGQEYGSGEVYKKEITAKEIALTLDTLYSSPYDIVVYYEKDLSGLIVEIIDNKVMIYNSIFRGKKFDPTSKEYDFAPTGINKINVKLESPKRIKFEKLKNSLIIEKHEINRQ